MQKIIFILTGVVSLFLSSGFAQTYNPQAAADYAEQWWNSRNPDYDNYDAYGGDCANFVSQCLIAGGLDLSAGTDGNGTGLKPHGVIAGVYQLVTHLKNYQETEYYRSTAISDVFDKTDLGDPVFFGISGQNEYCHSLFCSYIEGNVNYYSCHSDNYLRVSRDYFGEGITHYFHIKNSIPDHCTNCELDGDEESIDCGGSCPPCQHAPDNKSYTTNTSSLPSATYAINSITAGNATVEVLPSQNVAFYTVGEINLKPGFNAKSGSDFLAEIKRLRLQATADCDAFCDPIIYNVYNRYYDDFILELANATSLYVLIAEQRGSSFYPIYENQFQISSDGELAIWDLAEGASYDYPALETDEYSIYQFQYSIIIGSCQGALIPYEDYMLVFDRNFRLLPLIEEGDTNENMSIVFYPNPNR